MIILKTCCNGKCTQPLIRKTDDVCLTELPAFVLSRTAKQTVPCQSAGLEPQKCVRLFRYSYWLLRKSILNLANRIFADLRHVRGRKSRRIWDIEKASLTLLAHHLLIHNVQSVWMSAVTQRLVIQFSRYGHFCVLRLVRAYRNQNCKIYCYFRILQFISFPMIYSLPWFSL